MDRFEAKTKPEGGRMERGFLRHVGGQRKNPRREGQMEIRERRNDRQGQVQKMLR